MSSKGTKNTENTIRDEGKHPDDSEPAEAVSDVEESATLVENDKESEGDDSFYQDFNEIFEIPNMVPDSQSEVNLKRSSRKTSMPKKFSNFKIDSKSHLKLAFRYLKNASGKGISFNKGSDLDLKVYVDSGWAKCKVTRKSITGTKHFEIELFFLREKVVSGMVKTVKIKSADNTVDIFTKGLSVIDHNKFCESLGLKDLYMISLRGNIKNVNPNPVQRTEGESKLNSKGVIIELIEKFEELVAIKWRAKLKHLSLYKE
uniref:Ribonuclease H-like domain-containing protein n=1 Tax=Tanacetum cinerariifolium TaxID=118510 RepID=A0A6L2NIC7_TANCI|nr:ribonuclease H-like domain-containing protein [Tanacetum cinerariifolium]